MHERFIHETIHVKSVSDYPNIRVNCHVEMVVFVYSDSCVYFKLYFISLLLFTAVLSSGLRVCFPVQVQMFPGCQGRCQLSALFKKPPYSPYKVRTKGNHRLSSKI